MFGRRGARSSRARRRATFGVLSALALVVLVAGVSATLAPRMVQLAATDSGDRDRGAQQTSQEQAATAERTERGEEGTAAEDARESSDSSGEEETDSREDADSEASESGNEGRIDEADGARTDGSAEKAPDETAGDSAEQGGDTKGPERAERVRAEQRESGPPPPSDPTMSLSVPSLGLQGDTVRNSAAPAAMDQGAIKLPPTGFPWQEGANTYIAGHRIGYPGTESRYQFYDLPAMQNGDAVYLTDANGTTYEYRVSEKFAVAPTDTSVTEPQAGRDMVTLQTCVDSLDPSTWWDITPKLMEAGPDSGRLVVQADKVATYPA